MWNGLVRVLMQLMRVVSMELKLYTILCRVVKALQGRHSLHYFG